MVPERPKREKPTAVPAAIYSPDEHLHVPTVGLWDAIMVLRRRMWLVIGVTLAAVPVAAYVGYTTVPLYQAKAVIRLGDARRDITGGLVERRGAGLGGRSVDPLLSEVEVIASQSTIRAVLDSTPRLGIVTRGFPFRLLGEVWLAQGAMPDTLTLRFDSDAVLVRGRFGQQRTRYGEPFESGPLTFTILDRPRVEDGEIVIRPQHLVIDKIQEDLRVRPREMTDVVDLSFVAKDPDRAREVVNRVVQVFQAVNAGSDRSQARSQRQFIETQLAVSESLLADARNALGSFRAQQAGLTQARPDGSSQRELMGLQVRRDQLSAERRAYRELLQQLQDSEAESRRTVLRGAMALPRLADNVEAKALYEQLVGHEAALDSMAGVTAATNPDFRRVQDLVVVTEERLVAALEAAVPTAIRSLDAEIETLNSFMARNAATLREFSTTEAEEALLEGQVENARRMTDQLREAFQKAQLAEAVEVGQVEILDLAAIADPIGVGRLPRVAIILLVGLFAGAGSAFFAERADRAIRGQKELEAIGLPVLGIVPRLGRRKGTDVDWERASAPVVEALRGVRLNLVYAHATAGALTTTVTSPEEGDGKSFVSANLALAFAHSGQHTLLIDGDVRRGALHRSLSTQRKPGLTDLLRGDATRADILQETTVPHLHFIGCGTRTSHAPEHLGSESMAQLMGTLRTEYDVIIVDSAPLAAGIDALALGTVTGNMLLVVRGGRTNRELAEAKLDVVERLPIRLLGAVINAARMDASDRYYAYYLEGYELTDEPAVERLVPDRNGPAASPYGEPERPNDRAAPDGDANA
jgi:tyrosine-protein kinase Etk/Wzc